MRNWCIAICINFLKVSLLDIEDFVQLLMIMVIIFITGESPQEAAQRGKHREIVRLLKEKEEEELNLIVEVGNINCETTSCT